MWPFPVKKKEERPSGATPAPVVQNSFAIPSWGRPGIEIPNIMETGTETIVRTPDQAMKFTEYYTSINKISNTISSLSRNFLKGHVELTDDQYDQVFPWKKFMAPGISSNKMIKAWAINFLKGGNGYVVMERSPNFRPISYTLRQWNEMTPFRTTDNEVWYYDLKSKEVYHWYNVLHIADITGDDLLGKTKISAMGQQLGRAAAAQSFVGKYFNNGLFMSGVIQYPLNSGIDEKDIPGLQDQMKESYGFQKAGKIGIITEGGELKQFKTDIPLSDTGWIESEKTTKDDVRNAFGIPAEMKDENSRTEYMENAIIPIISMMEQEINMKVISIQDQNDIQFKFKIESLLRADVKTKAEVIEKNLRNSIYTINEARAFYNMPPIEGGDVPMVMANNMVPLSQLEEFINSKM
jgi:HK97 family phage portal protein